MPYTNMNQILMDMAKNPNSRDVIEKFIGIYLDDVEESSDFRELMNKIICDGITDPERIRNFMIIREYHTKLKDNNGHSKSAIIDLAESYTISERQVQNIIYKWSRKYKKRSNVKEV